MRWGVEPICRVLSEHGCVIAPSTYYDARARTRSVRDLRDLCDLCDEELKVEIGRVYHQNYGVYGARKVWLALNRDGVAVARCTVERLMGELGLVGARPAGNAPSSPPPSATSSPSSVSTHPSRSSSSARHYVLTSTNSVAWTSACPGDFRRSRNLHPRFRVKRQHQLRNLGRRSATAWPIHRDGMVRAAPSPR